MRTPKQSAELVAVTVNEILKGKVTNTHELFQHHLRVGKQNSRCLDILQAINKRKESIRWTIEWLETPDLDCMIPKPCINKEIARMNRYQTKVIPKLLSKYQNELIKLDQIYKA